MCKPHARSPRCTRFTRSLGAEAWPSVGRTKPPCTWLGWEVAARSGQRQTGQDWEKARPQPGSPALQMNGMNGEKAVGYVGKDGWDVTWGAFRGGKKDILEREK